MKTYILVEVETINPMGIALTQATRTLVDNFLYRPGVLSVKVTQATHANSLESVGELTIDLMDKTEKKHD